MDVKYKHVEGFPLYRVGDDGTVWSKLTKGSRKIGEWWKMKPSVDSHGYEFVGLFSNGKRKHFYVHILVAKLFIGENPQGLDVRHFDDVKRNNRVTNLLYGTRKENKADQIRNGNSNIGEKHGNAKLTRPEVEAIIKDVAGGKTHAVIAAEHGIVQQTVSDIVCRRTWRHVGGSQ